LFRATTQTWRVQLVDTGMYASIGERLQAVRGYLGDDEVFLANYSDVLTDAPLPLMVDNLTTRGRIASFLCVRPTYTSHFVDFDPHDGLVHRLEDVRRRDIWINGGFFIFRRELFDYMRAGDDLVNAPFQRLIQDQQIVAYPYEGFWVPMDTFKDRQFIESLVQRGQRPWAVWDPARELIATGSADTVTT
jgi:glucose-1-phosphate cytidylyltransferase